MTDEIPATPTPPPASVPVVASVPERTKINIGDVLFGWKSAVVIFIGGLILGGLGGAGIGAIGHHHHPRGERMMQMRGGGGPQDGYGYGGGFQGGVYGAPGGAPVPPGTPPTPNPSKPPTSSPSPKATG